MDRRKGGGREGERGMRKRERDGRMRDIRREKGRRKNGGEEEGRGKGRGR